VWFDFQDDANGPAMEIVYFNGRRVAMGDDLEPIVLFDAAKAGDKVLVAVILLQTVDEKHFTGADLRIDFSAGRPGPSEVPHRGEVKNQRYRGVSSMVITRSTSTLCNR